MHLLLNRDFSEQQYLMLHCTKGDYSQLSHSTTNIETNKMEFKSCKNVWGKKNIFGQEGTKSSWRNIDSFQGTKASAGSSKGFSLANGPFGSSMSSGSSSGPSSLPAFSFQKEKSKLYSFEVGSASSGSSCCSSTAGSGSSSLLTFGMEAKTYRNYSNCSSRPEESKMETSSGGSSRNSSNKGSNNQLDWSGMVESVFKEEIGKMSEKFHRGTGFGKP